jgi:hypothetical protein
VAVNGAQPAATDGTPATVLIGFADALAAPEAAWSLLDAGYNVVAFAKRGTRPPIRRCHGVTVVEITAPEEDAERSIAELERLLGAGEHAAIMPLNDSAVWLADRVRERGQVPPIAGPTGDRAALALDKRLQVEAATRAGFDVPPTRVVRTVEDALAIADLPVALKPSHPVSQQDGRLVRSPNHFCSTRAELEPTVREWKGREELLAQPLLSGVGEGLFGIAGRNGLVALSAHRRIRMMNPEGSGSSACVSIAVDPQLAAAATRMLTEAGWSGMFMLEFLRDADGRAWFMELNGRPWGSMALARRAGLEYPAWAMSQLWDPAFTPVSPEPAAGLVCRHLGRELVHVLMVMRGPKSAGLSRYPSRWRTLREVLRIRRGERWYNWRRSDWGLFVDDALQTVLGSLPRRAGV